MSGSQGSDAQLDRDAIERAFNALAKRLEELQVRGHIYIVGGAAMVLAHRRSKSTLDVDPLVIDPRGTVLQAAVDVAREQSLPADWLNDEVTKIAILPYRPDSKAQVLFDSPYLVVTGASARHMLAMKVRTGCSRDEDDIKLLLRRLKVKTLQQVRGVHQAAYPYDGIPWRSEERVKDLIRIVWEQRGQGGQPPSHAQEGDGGTDR